MLRRTERNMQHTEATQYLVARLLICLLVWCVTEKTRDVVPVVSLLYVNSQKKIE